MTKEDFITYVRAIIDMEIETAKRTNPIFPKDERYKTVEGLKEFVEDLSPQEPQYELIGALKLIEEALNKLNQVQPQLPQYVPGIAAPFISPYTPGTGTNPYTINCTIK
jgi:hypothetical protein